MFTWSEVYANDAALMFHLTNPLLVEFLGQHGEMGDGLGTLAAATKEASGFPIKYF